MNPIFGSDSDTLFSTMATRSLQSGQLAGGALSRGIDAYMKKDYQRAVTEFRRTIGLDPYSDNAIKAYDFMAQAYLRLGRPSDAESSYKQAIRTSPARDDMRLKLANLYFTQKRYDEAGKEYADAARINPSAQNIYSLGQLYLATNRLNDAETQFEKLLGMNSSNYGAIYSLGQIDVKRGNYDAAILKFQQAIEIKQDFAFAYSDLGMAYADMGQTDKAAEQARILDDMDGGLASGLRDYLHKVRNPKMTFATTFVQPDMTTGKGTLISSWDPALAVPNGSKDFVLTVYFDKSMDRGSVENIANWAIGRTTGPEQGGAYNWGLQIADTEVRLPPLPKNVYYDAESMSAKVTFTVTQNATSDGTIDPSHLVFRFLGKDVYGNAMDPGKDEYVGISLVV